MRPLPPPFPLPSHTQRQSTTDGGFQENGRVDHVYYFEGRRRPTFWPPWKVDPAHSTGEIFGNRIPVLKEFEETAFLLKQWL